MYKSRLQKLCQQNKWSEPKYFHAKAGPDHDPRFKATVDVNGVPYFSPGMCKSSKGAQNQAARMAINALTTPDHPFHAITIPGAADDTSQLYKNQLLIYAQQHKLGVPTYESVNFGPQHDQRFRAVVSIDGKRFFNPLSFPTKKGAEHAAAKVALMSLSPQRSDVSKACVGSQPMKDLVSGGSQSIKDLVSGQLRRNPTADGEAQVEDEDLVCKNTQMAMTHECRKMGADKNYMEPA